MSILTRIGHACVILTLCVFLFTDTLNPAITRVISLLSAALRVIQ